MMWMGSYTDIQLKMRLSNLEKPFQHGHWLCNMVQAIMQLHRATNVVR
jgi:hypothetical protein